MFSRPWQNNCLVPVTWPTLAQNALNRRLSIFLRAPARNWNHGDKIVESWWRYFPNGDMWCRLGVHGFHLGYRKLIHESVRTFKMLHFIHKNVPRVFSVKSDSLICQYMNINQVIGMSHGMQEPMESGRYHDIIIVTSSSWRHFLPSPRWWIHRNYRKKKRPNFAIKLHIFWFDFSKAVNLYWEWYSSTCIF